MAQLTEDQKAFLEHHGIPLSQVFDATYVRPRDFKVLMKELGFSVAIGVSPCAVLHTLRDRHNRCLQCSTASMGFARRYRVSGHVYAAYSWERVLVKVGSTTAPDQRIAEMNRHSYGSANDWELWYSRPCMRMGEVEAATHKLLGAFSLRSHTWMGNEVSCYELFSCDPEVAKQAIDEATDDSQLG